MKQQTYTKHILFGLGILAVLMIGLRWWLAARTLPQVTSFEECSQLDGSVIQESYPEVCVTIDGQRLVAPTPEPLPSPTPTPLLSLVSYENPWYRIQYPNSWQVLVDERVPTADQALLSLDTKASSSGAATLAIRVNRADRPEWLNQACNRLVNDDVAEITDIVTGTVQLYDLGDNEGGACVYEGLTGAVLKFAANGTDFQIDYVQDEADVAAAKDFEQLLFSFEPMSATQSTELGTL